MLNAGDRFGRYLIERILGAGGMGVVYLALDERLQRRVALKMMHLQMARDPAFMSRFRREARTLAMLTHPNVVAVYDLEERDGQAALVMEYVPGEGLDAVIARMGLVPPGHCLPIFRQIGKAIAYAHSQGVIHRDLKPANVMLSPQGTAKVMDFGIARLVSETATRLTRPGASVGTLGYMSLEVLKGQDATEVSDVYSLGVILYEMLTGRLPHNATTYDALLDQMIAPVPPPRSFYPYISNSLENALLRALATDPAQRYPRVEDFLSCLEAIDIEDQGQALDIPAPALSPGPSTVAPRATDRHTVGRSELPSPTVLDTSARSVSESVEQVAPPVPRSRKGVTAVVLLVVAAFAAILIIMMRSGVFGSNGPQRPAASYENKSEHTPAGYPVPLPVTEVPSNAAPEKAVAGNSQKAPDQSDRGHANADHPSASGTDRYFLILGSYKQPSEEARAQSKLQEVRNIFPAAHIINSNEYSNLVPNLWVVVIGPQSEVDAKQMLRSAQQRGLQSYVKRGW